MKGTVIAFLLSVGLTGLTAPGAPPTRAPGLYAEVTTARGLIVMQLRPDAAPLAVASFVGLAEGTIANAALDPGVPYFDGTTFHRVVAGHVIQTGIPNSKRARAPGYSFPNEIDARLSHDHAGALGMANSGPGTNGSQWYITLANRAYLDGDYTVFGQVVEGMDAVLKIQKGDALDSVRIVRVGAEAEKYHPTTASFQVLLRAAQRRVAREAVRKQKAEQDWIARNYPRTQPAPANGVRIESLAHAATGASGGVLRVRYRGQAVRYVGDWSHAGPAPIKVTKFASGADGVPGFHDQQQAFEYRVGESKLNPGLDGALATMKPGDRNLVVVPAAQGYGRAGLYPPETPGQPRFVISANELLVYDIEALPPSAAPGTQADASTTASRRR